MTFFAELGTGLAASLIEKQIEKNSIGAMTFAREVRQRWTDGSLGVFIFGPQGTGKSTALQILAGERDVNDIPTEYDSSSRNEFKKYNGHLFFKVFAGPGQPDLANAHWPALFDKINKFDRALCVFCVSYGCHSVYEENLDAIKISSSHSNQELLIKEYLESCRHRESNLFREFCIHLSAVQGKVGLLLLATKQDLWWTEREAVSKHYNRGAFKQGFQKLADAKKATGFVAAKQSASLSLQNLLTSEQELLVPTVGGYDQLLQRVNYLALLKKLEEMVQILTEK